MTFIAALRLDRISAPWVIDSPINGDRLQSGPPKGRNTCSGARYRTSKQLNTTFTGRYRARQPANLPTTRGARALHGAARPLPAARDPGCGNHREGGRDLLVTAASAGSNFVRFQSLGCQTTWSGPVWCARWPGQTAIQRASASSRPRLTAGAAVPLVEG